LTINKCSNIPGSVTCRADSLFTIMLQVLLSPLWIPDRINQLELSASYILVVVGDSSQLMHTYMIPHTANSLNDKDKFT